VSSWEIAVELMKIAPATSIAEALNMPLELALTLFDARAKLQARRCNAAPPTAAPQAEKRVINHGDGRQTIHFSGDAAFDAMRQFMVQKK
jgi:hypothetical protein